MLEGPSPAMAPPAPAEAPPEVVHAPKGKLFRDDVTQAVDQGFALFLQKLRVEPDLRDGKFVGWVVRALYQQDFWDGVDLGPGDVVTRVNGKSIERDNEAYDTFQSLKTAPRLTVDYTREGQARTLNFDIIERNPTVVVGAPAEPARAAALPRAAAPPSKP